VSLSKSAGPGSLACTERYEAAEPSWFDKGIPEECPALFTSFFLAVKDALVTLGLATLIWFLAKVIFRLCNLLVGCGAYKAVSQCDRTDRESLI